MKFYVDDHLMYAEYRQFNGSQWGPDILNDLEITYSENQSITLRDYFNLVSFWRNEAYCQTYGRVGELGDYSDNRRSVDFSYGFCQEGGES